MFKTRKDTTDFIRSRVSDVKCRGLEVSPDMNPIVRTTSNVSMEYLDVCSTQELRDRALDRGRALSDVPDIDYHLEYHRPISECVKGNKYDFVVSSHVIEHIPNLIGHFEQVNDVLVPNGLYAFLVPDKDLCFDTLKSATSLGQLIEAHIERHTIPPISSMVNEFYYGVKRGDKGAWSIHDKEPFRPKYPQYKKLIKNIVSNSEQIKNWHGHIWSFTPRTFQILYQELVNLDLVKLELEDVIATEHMEFIVLLRKK